MLEQVLKIWAISITFSGERHPEWKTLSKKILDSLLP
jgi:hypothetical protein